MVATSIKMYSQDYFNKLKALRVSMDLDIHLFKMSKEVVLRHQKLQAQILKDLHQLPL